MRKQKAGHRENPLVPIRGDRVAAALRFKGLSNRQAASLLTGVLRQRQRLSYGEVKPQGIDQIVLGKRTRCRQWTRDALAEVIGPPITAAYLSGEEDVRLDPLDGFGLLGEGLANDESEIGRYPMREMGPGYDLSALGLTQEILSALKRDGVDRGLGDDPLRAVRMALGLTIWRDYALKTDTWGERDELARDAEEFAEHMVAAVRVLLRPFLTGRAPLRPFILDQIGRGMDWIEERNQAMWQAVQTELPGTDGELRPTTPQPAKLAVLDVSGASPSRFREMKELRAELIRTGRKPAEIAEAIYEAAEQERRSRYFTVSVSTESRADEARRRKEVEAKYQRDCQCGKPDCDTCRYESQVIRWIANKKPHAPRPAVSPSVLPNAPDPLAD